MGTLYRKVTFEINDKDHDEILLIGKSANFIFNPNTRNGEELSDFLAGCEEITDNSHQIEKLEAEKKEILEALGISLRLNKAFGANSEWIEVQEIESLIQKHKQ